MQKIQYCGKASNDIWQYARTEFVNIANHKGYARDWKSLHLNFLFYMHCLFFFNVQGTNNPHSCSSALATSTYLNRFFDWNVGFVALLAFQMSASVWILRMVVGYCTLRCWGSCKLMICARASLIPAAPTTASQRACFNTRMLCSHLGIRSANKRALFVLEWIY